MLQNSGIEKHYKIVEKQVDLQNKKQVIYTCIVGEYDQMYDPLIIAENTEYIIFSDNKNIVKGLHTWKLKEIPDQIKEICNQNSILINRYIKMHAKELFPNYDYALYIDGSIRIISDLKELFYRINDKTGLAMHRHRKREDIYEEAQVCMKQKRGNKNKIKQQIKKYKAENFPEKFGMIEAGMIAIDLKNRTAEKILTLWWEEFLEEQSERDQLALPYILWKNNYEIEDIGFLGENIAYNKKWRIYEHSIIKK